MSGEENKNFYDLLGVLPSASMAELKRAYRARARTFHPDLNPSQEAQDQFRAVQEAYNLLRDPVERTFYDRGLGFKSNWVEEAAKSSERKKAKERTKRAEAAMGGSAASSAPPKDSGKAKADTPPKDAPNPPPPPPSDTDSKSAGAGTPPKGHSQSEARGGRGSRGRRFTGFTSGASERRRSFNGASTRNTGARTGNKDSSTSAPQEPAGAKAPEPQPPIKLPWYRDKALRIFLFGANTLAALVLFFTAPERGVYFLVLAFGIELFYRVSDLKPPEERP